MVKKYRMKTPKSIEAMQYTGENLDEIQEFVGTNLLALKGIPLLKKGEFVVKTDDIFTTFSENRFHQYFDEEG